MFIMATPGNYSPNEKKISYIAKKRADWAFQLFLSKRLFEMRFGLAPLTDNVKHEKTDLRNLFEKRKLNAKGGSNVTFAIVVC